MTKRRLIISVMLSLFLATVFCFLFRTMYIQNEFENSLYDNVIRFHVIANSDSDYDQIAKLEIKDELLSRIGKITKDSDSAEEAYTLLYDNLGCVKDLAKSTVCALGYDYEVEVSLKNEKYPVRFYDGFALPSGNYKSLVVSLGKASGRNWWCVLYPSVCESPASEFSSLMIDAGVSGDAVGYLKTDNGRIVKIYFFEFFKKLITGEDNGTQNFR